MTSLMNHQDPPHDQIFETPFEDPSEMQSEPLRRVQVLLITCVDFRLRSEVSAYMESRGLIGHYDEITLPGASLGVMNEVYPHWQKAFLEQFRLLKKIHHFDHVLFMDHRDCGMYKLVLGEDHLISREVEYSCHLSQMIAIKEHLFQHMPDLTFEGVIMELDGTVTSLLL